MLSHSTWRDEKSVVRWRTEGEHHVAQGKGRFEVFADYHLRVGDVIADTSPPEEAPIFEQRFDATEVGVAKLVTFTEMTPKKDAGLAAQPDLLATRLGLDLTDGAVAGHDVFASIYNPGKLVLLTSWKDTNAGKAWSPEKIEGIETLRHRRIRVVRDYGRFDRREAPQFYADVRGFPTKHPEPAR
jgi:heme-degrading monooxygenase HmoA